MQIPWHTLSTVDAYVANEEWRHARLSCCPLHPRGGCSFARHGSYERLTTPGVRIARWYCPEGRRTFSLLPDFLAARLPGLLASIENSVIVAHSSRSMEAAADALRGLDISLPSAMRWLNRRVRSVRASINAVILLMPQPLLSMSSSLACQRDSGEGHLLTRLRAILSAEFLNRIPVPLGFKPSRCCEQIVRCCQHEVGPDSGVDAHYAAVIKGIRSLCNTKRSIETAQPCPALKTSSGMARRQVFPGQHRESIPPVDPPLQSLLCGMQA